MTCWLSSLLLLQINDRSGQISFDWTLKTYICIISSHPLVSFSTFNKTHFISTAIIKHLSLHLLINKTKSLGKRNRSIATQDRQVSIEHHACQYQSPWIMIRLIIIMKKWHCSCEVAIRERPMYRKRPIDVITRLFIHLVNIFVKLYFYRTTMSFISFLFFLSQVLIRSWTDWSIKSLLIQQPEKKGEREMEKTSL